MVAMEEVHAVPLSEKDMQRLLDAARADRAHEHFTYRGTPEFSAMARQICLDNKLDPGERMLMVLVQEGCAPMLRLSAPNAGSNGPSRDSGEGPR